MKGVVVDASAAAAFILPSQATPAAQSFFDSRQPGLFVAPSIFTWEITNVLVRLGLRGLQRGAIEEALDAITTLEIAIQAPPPDPQVLILAREAFQFGLSVFDTAYLRLAIERDCALASRDDRLLGVARRFVPCLDLQGERII